MKKKHFLKHPVVIFVLAQLAWLSLVAIWIYWYVSNYIIFETVEDKLSPQLASKSSNVIALVIGLILLVAILAGMYMIFIYLNKQLSITKLYDNFIGNVTHELKSPLASIQLYLETMKIHDVPREKQKEFIAIMLKDTNRLNQLINSILKISGLEQKKIAHNFNVYQVESLIHNLVEDAWKQYKIDPQAIQVVGKAPCQCVIDPNAMKIVFDNLIDNAVKYSQDEVHLTIKLWCDSRIFTMEFIDRGIGIPLKEQQNVFKKFHRIYDQDIPNVKGTGLGLYWVKEIIKYHGGKISVSSKGVGKGSTFKIELPIYQTSKKRYLKFLLETSKKIRKKQDGQYG